MLRLMKPNISHLKVFGCICYARTETPGRKKLDDRTRMLVHLGTEPGSKAYRLLDPVTKRIVVSRDVHFIEDKEWSWKETEQKTEHPNPGEFVVNIKTKGDDEEEEEGAEFEAKERDDPCDKNA